MSKCPNWGHPDMKKLTDSLGKEDAFVAYIKNGDKIPTLDKAKELINNTTAHEKITPTPEFRTWEFGEFEGKNEKNHRAEIDDDILNHPDKPIGKTGESFNEFKDRVLTKFSNLLQTAPDNTLITTHSSILKMVEVWDKEGRPHDLHVDPQKYIDSETQTGALLRFNSEHGTLFIARHGQTTDNVKGNLRSPETQLTDKGIDQANEVGKELSNVPLDKVYSSPLPRTIHTSSLILDHQKDLGFKFPAREQFYQLAGTEGSKASPKTVEMIKEFLTRIGFKLDSVKDIYDDAGNKIDANGITNLLARVIHVVDGAEASTLPEEAMHVVTRILREQDKAIYDQMMNNINKYRIFQDVMDSYKDNKNYQTTDGRPDIIKLKEEAVGKVLAEYVIRDAADATPEKPELIAKAQNWWERVKDGIRKLLGRAKIDPFEQVASDFNQGKVNLDKDTNLGEDTFLQQNTDEKGKKLFDNIKGIPEPVKVEDGQGNSHYEVDGKVVKNRVTDFSKNYLDGIFRNKPQLKDKITEVINELKKGLGVGGHADIEHIFDNHIDADTGLLRDKSVRDNTYVSKIDPADKTYYEILEAHLFGYEGAAGHIPGLVDKFPAGTRFMWEKKIYDPRRDLAGTVDFMAITPDGKVNLFDWKFKGKLEENAGIRDYMKDSYDIQMDKYVGILKQQYGVTDVGQVRIVPISVKYDDAGKFQNLKIGDVNYDQVAAQDKFLLPYPTSSERFGNTKLDGLVDSLSGLLENTKNKAIGAEGKEAKDLKVRSLEEAILQLRLTKAFTPLLDQAKLFNTDSKKQLEAHMNSFNTIDFSKISAVDMSKKIAPLNEMLADLAIYADLGKFIDYLPKEEKETKERMVQESAVASKLLEHAQTTHGKYLVEYFKHHSITDILTKELELGVIGREAYALSKSQSRTMQAFYDINNQKNNIVQNQTNDVIADITKINENLEKWSGGGASGLKKYQALIEKKDSKGQGTNERIDRIKSDFYKGVKARFTNEADKVDDIKWAKANVDHVAFKTWADEYLASRIEAIKNLRIPGETETVEQKKQFMLDQVNRETDLANDYAWTIPKNISRFPNTDIWHSPEYRELLKPENAPVKALYDFIDNWSKEAAKIGYLEWSDAHGFMPWIEKSLFERFALGGKWSLKDSILEGLTQIKNDNPAEPRNPVTGKLLNQLPKFFTHDISTTNEDGTVDYSRVSDDLIKNAGLFAHAVIDYRAKSNIEDLAESLLAVEKYKGMLEANSKGKPTGRTNQETANLKFLEDAQKVHLYGQNTLSNVIEASGGKVTVNGDEREFTSTKGLDAIKTAYQLTVLGFNASTSVFRGLNTNLQGIYTSGKHYTTRQMMESYWDFLGLRTLKGSHELSIAMLKDFLPVDENLHEAIKHLSANKLSGADFQEILMKWVKSAHNIVQYSNYLAHTKNAIIMDGKLINARDYIRDSQEYKDRYNASETSRKEIETGFDAKVQKLIDEHGLINNATFNKETGRAEYKGLDLNDASVADWKSLIRVSGRRLSGNISEDDQSHMRSNALLRQTMLFTNWLPQQLDIRFGELAYNKGIDAYEYGRTRMMFKILAEHGMKSLSTLRNMYKANSQGVMALNDMYQKHAASYQERTGNPLEMSKEEFYDMVRENIRVQAREAITALSVIGFAMGAVAALPVKKDQDDGSVGYLAFMQRVLNRSKDELQLYYNPLSFTAYADGAKIPALSYIDNTISAIKNVAEGLFGYATDDDKLIEKAHIVKHLINPLPVAHNFWQLFGMIDPEAYHYLGGVQQTEVKTGNH